MNLEKIKITKELQAVINILSDNTGSYHKPLSSLKNAAHQYNCHDDLTLLLAELDTILAAPSFEHSTAVKPLLSHTDDQPTIEIKKLLKNLLSTQDNFSREVDITNPYFLHSEPDTKPVPPVQMPLVEQTQQEAVVPIQTAFISNSSQHLPSINLLDKAEHLNYISPTEELEAKSRLIESILNDYKITVDVVGAHQGPVITLFELQLSPGIKVSKITNLVKDLARSLLVVSVRVVEVMEGLSTVGLEIPNSHRQTVYLSEVFNSTAFKGFNEKLPLVLGQDISGQPVVADLVKMPHLLVAGTTGSGKSVGINAMILSLLFKATPDQLRMIMIDPKMLELSIYEDIPHLLAPVVTDMKEASNALRWSVLEMERRYKLMSKLGVRNLDGYNKKIKNAQQEGKPLKDPLFEPNLLLDAQVHPDLETLPFIVIVIDEFADMMMIVGKKVEELIARLAQKARAAGIHLVLATQRPSVDVITGLIKANIPTRIAFQVSTKIDSRTILDQMGAEQLLGNGDMLYLPPGTGLPKRIHGAFVSDDEVHRVVADLKQHGTANYIDEILKNEGSEMIAGISGETQNESDPLYDEAVAIVTETRRASISGVQRRLKVGYNRAARMIEDMEAAGVVSTPMTNGQREVLAPPPI